MKDFQTVAWFLWWDGIWNEDQVWQPKVCKQNFSSFYTNFTCDGTNNHSQVCLISGFSGFLCFAPGHQVFTESSTLWQGDELRISVIQVTAKDHDRPCSKANLEDIHWKSKRFFTFLLVFSFPVGTIKCKGTKQKHSL